MSEPLFLTDLLLALAVLAAAAALGWKAGRPRWVLYGTAALVVTRLLVALALLITGGPPLADTRLLLQIPLALLPLALAVARPVLQRPAAVGIGLSAAWQFIPYAQQEALIALALSLTAMCLTAILSRRRGPWGALGFLLPPAILLAFAYQGNVADVHHTQPAAHHGHGSEPIHHESVSLATLTGPRDRAPDVRFTLSAAHGKVTLASGREIDALTFNGRTPGPELRVQRGTLVEVTLSNIDVAEGVTLHWHGVDVPNAEDGVPGVTQEAVMPGDQHVYRFVPERAGTFWYHTHRDAARNVERGLFGALIVEDVPAPHAAAAEGGPAPRTAEQTVFTHLWPDGDDPIAAFDTADRPTGRRVAAGRPVLLRLINSSEEPHRLHLGGTQYRVTAIDGNPTHGATPLPRGTDLLLAAGGRLDVAFTMTPSTVSLSIDVNEIPDTAALAFSPDGHAAPAHLGTGPLFDPLRYGTGRPAERVTYDRDFEIRLDDGFGFTQGSFTYVSSSINGRLYPAVPTLTVTEGDRVKITIVNRSIIDHPLHLHGHRVRVLSRNGVATTGGTWWTDTLNVAPGEIFEIDFVADNPGIWMDHCHNFRHGADGMIMHLGYTGVTSPFAENHIPE
ncbi:multicopper oxidase family protein [Nonomuraea sp. NPDC050451]|uniref:multicopper oxidase family protein n=1 Tax=Nonomuraea sp. NPDC050451 TaxID=3364364 RepID=UPI00379D5E56